MLPKVWPAVRKLQANTLSVPIGWAQIEPAQGSFDFSFLTHCCAKRATTGTPGAAVVRHLEEQRP
jgi:hypothetical protein